MSDVETAATVSDATKSLSETVSAASSSGLIFWTIIVLIFIGIGLLVLFIFIYPPYKLNVMEKVPVITPPSYSSHNLFDRHHFHMYQNQLSSSSNASQAPQAPQAVTITINVPASTNNGTDHALVSGLGDTFTFVQGQSQQGVLLNPSGTLAMLVYYNNGNPYNFIVPATNGTPTLTLTNTSTNGASCNTNVACGSTSLQGVLTSQQWQIIGSYTTLPINTNGVPLNPNMTDVHGLTATQSVASS